MVIEFLSGARDAAELQAFEAFLSAFESLDQGDIRPSDWHETLRLARRIPRDGRPRQLCDCLIRALANRLRCDVLTVDHGFPRS